MNFTCPSCLKLIGITPPPEPPYPVCPFCNQTRVVPVRGKA